MARHPFEADGTLRNQDGKWMIELQASATKNLEETSGPRSFGPNGLSEGTPIRLLYWTDLPDGLPTEIEAIAKAQQLDLSVVAYGLEAEGSLYDGRETFLRNLEQQVE